MKTVKRVIFVGGYSPGDAASNFVISFCRGYAELGLDVKLIAEVEKDGLLPPLPGIDVYPVLYNNTAVVGGYLRERLIDTMIKKFYVSGETVVQYYSSPTYGYLHCRRSYLRFDTYGEVPFADPNKSIGYKMREWLRRLATRKTAGLLVQTTYLKEYFINYGIKNICVYNILIDPARFQNLRKTSDDRIIAYCGKVGLYKDGVNDLIDAFSIVNKNIPDIKLRIIGGFASSSDEEILKDKVKDLGLNEVVEFTGKVLPSEMPQLLYDAEVLALARPDNKQAKYGFPSKLGEYLFTSNPVVLTRVGEIDHFLRDKESCIFAKPEDPENFAEKLLWALNNQEEARQIGFNGRKVAEQQFSVQSQCKVTLSFFDTILKHSEK